MQTHHWQNQLNQYGAQRQAVFFLIDFEAKQAEIYLPDELPNENLQIEFPKITLTEEQNAKSHHVSVTSTPLPRAEFDTAFDYVKQNLLNGNSYLTNLTFSTPISIEASLKDIFLAAKAKYKILHKNWVCFSPESFVQIAENTIHTFPMKGTISAEKEGALEELMQDAKETAEHNTIVDLLRNDLSIVAKNVRIARFRYAEKLNIRGRNLWQTSTHIMGDLPEDWHEHLGDILAALLPAGSISGAPKKKTCEIIRHAEEHDRGFYTGIAGYFDGTTLDSCVMIRFIEEDTIGNKVYKSGGGITAMSYADAEYQEIQDKIYVPIL
ncbi:MAG: aminodeoxychorismate synthase component I [Weeksellaceae bacterium]|nr:aminodeoxychorismate synthase component I [Weeksellaceae bacterium]